MFKLDELGSEIAQISIPAALALAADPVASLVDTAFIGRIGAVELAAVGVSIAVFNQLSKVAIYPLLSVTTSFVAEESASCKVSQNEKSNQEEEEEDLENKAGDGEVRQTREVERAFVSSGKSKEDGKVADTKMTKNKKAKMKYIPSVSSSMIVGLFLGILQTILLIFSAKYILNLMGVKSNSPMMAPAYKYLRLRAIGAPAILLSLAIQGVFRGFKDTKTPLYATVTGDLVNIILDAVFILGLRWGVSGAAISHVISQYLISLLLLLKLAKMVQFVPSSIHDLEFSRFLKCGFLLLARVIAVTFCVTLSASLAARHGPIPMAAFQICLQLWLSTSLLADGLAVAGQTILATAFAKGENDISVAASSRVLQLSTVLGLGLTLILGVFMEFGMAVFTKDPEVIKLVKISIPFVAGTQIINSMAFVFDGINFGASDYIYSAYSMETVAIVSVTCLFLLDHTLGFIGIWSALVIYITLRALAGIWRMGAACGPWSFLRHFDR
ncbi:MATE efflux family protein 1 [Zostera marina]|uniref:Protein DETOXIFICATION n=1 Tax=Zostera marina TaxID=29655 RepID=A0A0K9NW35_ZOSMR|nr:MATE efflux family protein 1 [Zostera marina]